MRVLKKKIPFDADVKLHAKSSADAFGEDKEYSQSLCCNAQIERRRANFRKQVAEFPVCTKCHRFCVDNGKFVKAWSEFDISVRMAVMRWRNKVQELVGEVYPQALSPGLEEK